MNDIKKLTWLAYLTFTFIGVTFISQGVLIIYLAKDYNLPLAIVGYLFFIPAVLQALMTYLSGYILDRLNLKKVLYIAYGLILFSYVCFFSQTLPILILGLITIGIGNGVMLTLPNYTIITLHSNNKFSKLNILNFFFSLGGITGPFIIGALLDYNIPWRGAFSLVFVIGALLLIFVYKTNFKPLIDESVNAKEQSNGKRPKWNLSIYLIGAGLLLYVLSEVIFSSWIVAYFKMEYGFTIFNATLALTLYWFFITFGRFAADKIGKNMKIYNFILTSSLVATIPFIFIFFTKNTTINFIIIAIMGLGYASLYASMFSYGMDQLKTPCTKTMSFFVLCGTIGNILAMPISSYFVEHFSVISALIVSLIMIAAVVVLVYLTLYDKQNIAIESRKRRIWGAITKVTKIFTPGKFVSTNQSYVSKKRVKKKVYLSYEIDESTPSFGNKSKLNISTINGVCNVSTITLPMHLGTHLDLPYHFHNNGQTIDDFDINYFKFSRILFVEVTQEDLIINEELVTQLSRVKNKEKYDMLIIKTGACNIRTTEEFWINNYGFSPDVANYLRENFVNIRLMATDSISISSFQHSDIGVKSHKAFLLPEKPILIIEDMDLRRINSHTKVSKINIAPLRVRKCDGLPCTITGIIKE